MNIFYLDTNPTLIALDLCDKHIVKMPLESTQMLCTVARKHGIESEMRSTHINHPCVLWTGFLKSNYEWHYKLAWEMYKEYTFRYGRIHSCQKILAALPKTLDLPDGFTSPPLAMPNEFKTQDTIESYRNYYKYKSIAIQFKYTKRTKPNWL